MKKNIRIVLFAFILFINHSLFAQNPTVEIAQIIQNEEMIEFSVVSSSQFYVGGNIYILHIGKKEFKLSKQTDDENKSTLTFFIPFQEFNALKNKDAIWLSYGNIVKINPESSQEAEAICKECPRTCWCLGEFNKNMLSN